MVRHNSANKRARYQYGNNRYVQSYFFDENSTERRVSYQANKHKETSQWDAMSDEEKREYILLKYGPGKRHNKYVCVVINFKDKDEYEYVTNYLPSNSSDFPRLLKIKLKQIEPISLRFSSIDKMVIHHQDSWLELTFRSKETRIMHSLRKDSQKSHYDVKMLITGCSRFNPSYFEKMRFSREFKLSSNVGESCELYYKDRVPIKGYKKEDVVTNKSPKEKGITITLEVENSFLMKCKGTSVVTVSKTYPCEIVDIPHKVSKLFLISKDTQKWFEAQVIQTKSSVELLEGELKAVLKFHSLEEIVEMTFKKQKLLFSYEDENNHCFKIYV